MQTNSMSLINGLIFPLLLGLVIAGIAAATLAGRPLPLIASPRAALIAMLVIGMAMCAPGIGQVSASGRWLSPVGIAGILLGAAILAVIAAGLFGGKLPWIENETQAVAAVGVLIAVKFVIATADFFLKGA